MTINSINTNKAFVGVSLDSKLFSRQWMRHAFDYILKKHSVLLFLIADDLLRYTRTTRVISGKTTLNISETSRMINRRCQEFERFINSEIRNVDCSSQDRILVKTWNSFADCNYVQLYRNLQIAYATIEPFQRCVNDVAIEHINYTLPKQHVPNLLQTSAAFLLDEVAMCLRLTEMDEFSFEYYPSNQIDILTQLYDDRFTSYGLSVENLTGKADRKRQFYTLIDTSENVEGTMSN